ncbi:MAG: CDP-alcohol phosphatidyltransferase family protein [Deltaproteobacteria bacterium]|nr:CDP-alcohol phosphatidyltransferase family protein [Deltaproteobacteria bacterium]
MTRVLRYLAPNLITLSSMIFGLVSLWSSHNGDPALAAWMIIYAVLTDRIDGVTARALKATSELGMQLDSFADFMNFGIAPAYLLLVYLSNRPDLPFQSGTAHYLLFAACGAYMLCAVFRLARYNVLTDDQIPTKIFFGFPTTLTGGLIAIWFLLLLKYDPTSEAFGGSKLFGDHLHTPLAVWKYFPIALAVGGYLMASRLPMPKVGMTKNKAVSFFLLALIAIGYVCGFAMHYPEICFGMPTVWSIIFLVWGQASPSARAMYPPPLFPKKQPEKKLERPQEDLEDIVLDESRQSEPSLEPGSSGSRKPETD